MDTRQPRRPRLDRRGRDRWPLLGFAWLALAGPTFAADRPDRHGAFYIDAYGLIDPATEPLAARAHALFERVRAAAALPGRRTARLLVIPAAGSPWALVLPDGHLVVTRGAIEVCYRGADPDLGDTRLAFVLGHELAHLAKDDFRHDAIHRALMGDSAARATADLLERASDANPERQEQRRLKEAEADDWGFVYAAVAGFPVQRLLDAPAGEQRGTPAEPDFFRFWVEQTGAPAGDAGAHPTPADRAVLLRNRLVGILGALEFWHCGVRLLQADRLDDARLFLEAFQERFPSREVLANLGYIHLRLALRRMPAALGQRFWMPWVFDIATRAAALAREGTRGDGLTPEVAGLLRTAAGYLDQAVTLDPGYAPAWTNLAVVRFQLGEMHLARHAVDRALALTRTGVPTDPALAALKAVIIAGSDPELDLWPQAVARLDALLAAHPEAPAVRWNLARLLAERGRIAAAEPHWAWLRAHADRLPPPYAEALCGGAGGAVRPGGAGADCPAAARPTPAPFPWPLPYEPGADLLADQSKAAALEGAAWQIQPFDFGGPRRSGSIRTQPGRYAVLVLDGYLDTLVLSGPGLGTAADLSARAGRPRSVQAVPGAGLWTYDSWGATIRDGQVVEAWAMRGERIGQGNKRRVR